MKGEFILLIVNMFTVFVNIGVLGYVIKIWTEMVKQSLQDKRKP